MELLLHIGAKECIVFKILTKYNTYSIIYGIELVARLWE